MTRPGYTIECLSFPVQEISSPEISALVYNRESCSLSPLSHASRVHLLTYVFISSRPTTKLQSLILEPRVISGEHQKPYQENIYPWAPCSIGFDVSLLDMVFKIRQTRDKELNKRWRLRVWGQKEKFPSIELARLRRRPTRGIVLSRSALREIVTVLSQMRQNSSIKILSDMHGSTGTE